LWSSWSTFFTQLRHYKNITGEKRSHSRLAHSSTDLRFQLCRKSFFILLTRCSTICIPYNSSEKAADGRMGTREQLKNARSAWRRKKEALVLEKWLWLCKIPSCISRGVLMMLHPRSADEKKPVYTRRVVSILASLDWEYTSPRIRGGSDVRAVQGGSLWLALGRARITLTKQTW